MEHDGGSWTPTDHGTVKTTRGKEKPFDEKCGSSGLGGWRLASQAITLVEWLGVPGGRGLSGASLVGGLAPAGYLG
ncbi:hypothetical protein NEUTE2DRAFT_123291 [Neurospora tetrasperma FGSC 2509]|nr:hypothetical protein NEUTE2DRAFT_123291 [Neurospora tetrasperma FGSC 2509]